MTEVATRIGWSLPKMSRLLQGKYRATPVEIATILAICGVTSGPVRTTMLELAEDLAWPTWTYEHSEGPSLESVALGDMEKAAVQIVCFDATTVPPLFQSRAYMNALHEPNPVADSGEVCDCIGTRIVRQRDIGCAEVRDTAGEPDRSSKPHVAAFIGTKALSRVMFTSSVVTEQTRHLVELSTRPNVVIRIIPDDAPSLYASSPFQLMHYEEWPPVAHVAHLYFGWFSQRRATFTGYQRFIAGIAARALSVDESRDFLNGQRLRCV